MTDEDQRSLQNATFRNAEVAVVSWRHDPILRRCAVHQNRAVVHVQRDRVACAVDGADLHFDEVLVDGDIFDEELSAVGVVRLRADSDAIGRVGSVVRAG